MLLHRRPLALCLALLFAVQGPAVAAASTPLPADVTMQPAAERQPPPPCHGSAEPAQASAAQTLPCCEGSCPDMLGCVLSVLAPVQLSALPPNPPALSWTLADPPVVTEAPGHAALRPPIRL
jgi:hypothetical protein